MLIPCTRRTNDCSLQLTGQRNLSASTGLTSEISDQAPACTQLISGSLLVTIFVTSALSNSPTPNCKYSGVVSNASAKAIIFLGLVVITVRP